MGVGSSPFRIDPPGLRHRRADSGTGFHRLRRLNFSAAPDEKELRFLCGVSSTDFCEAKWRPCLSAAKVGLRNEKRRMTFRRRFAVPEKIRVSKSCNGIITRFRYRCQKMCNTLSETAQAKPPVSAIGVLQPLSGPGRRLLFLFCFSSGRRCIFSGFLIQ